MKWFQVGAALAVLSTLLVAGARAETKSAEKGKEYLHADPKAVEWFREARFGMFIHWGVYSLLGRGEWVMQNESIPISEYEKLPPRFNPTQFNAHDWVKLAKDSGIRYITITSKHHDGFAMYGTKLSDYNIVDRTPFKRDPLKELADECHRQGVKLFFYYSQLDWHHPDYYPRGGTGRKTGRPEHGDWEKYKAYYIGQVRELCTNYGEIGGIWFDGWWDNKSADWAMDTLYPMIHQLQPKALVGNNHHVKPFPGEDFQMFEQDLPGQNTAGFNTTTQSALPYETCRTMNNSWGLNTRDQAHRPAPDLIRYLVQAAGRDANLLLNTGPLPTGEILPEHRERYLAMGQWLKKNGKSIYATRGGPFRPQGWGVSTYKGRDVYLHVLNWPASGVVELPGLTEARSARGFSGGEVKVETTAVGTRVTLPDTLRDPIDSIIVLRLNKPVDEIKPATAAASAPVISGQGASTLSGAEAQVSGSAQYEADKDCVGYWTDASSTVSWKPNVQHAGRYAVTLTYACDRGSGGSAFTVACGSSRLTGTVAETGSWSTFRTVDLGTLELGAGSQAVTVRGEKKPGLAVMNLRSLTLKPVP